MAKKFSQVYLDAKFNAYNNDSTMLTILASMNKTVMFKPDYKPNQVAGQADNVQFNVQRRKRNKVKEETANHNPGSTSDELALLDSFSTADWETVGVGTGKLQTIGVKTGLNAAEKFDPDAVGSLHASWIADSWNAIAVRQTEMLIAALAGDLTKADTTTFKAPATVTRDAVIKAANEIRFLVDDFKYMARPIIFAHPSMSNIFEKEMGQTYTQEMPVYNTGLKTRYSIGGYPVVVVDMFNMFKDANDNRLSLIVADVDAFAFKNLGNYTVDTKLGMTRYYGKAFYQIAKIVDPARIKTFVSPTTFLTTATTTASKQSNA